MQAASAPNPQTDGRHDPRALICASALVIAEGRPTSEHLTYDLSAGGVRLCGLPHARVGDELRAVLRLPTAQIQARGQLVRVGETTGRPDFAIQFVGLSADAEDAIHDAVVEALSRPDRRSVLLLQSKREPLRRGWHWLEPVLALCARATAPIAAVECIEEHAIEMGILDTSSSLDTSRWAAQAPEWINFYPEIFWRAIDEAGRLRPAAAPWGLTFH